MLIGEFMSYRDQYQVFLTDKQAGLFTIQNYAFLANHRNRSLILQEFNHLSEILKEMGGFHPDVWRRFYYYCGLLNQYYLSHDEPEKAAECQRKAAASTFRNSPAPIENEQSILNNAYKFLGIENEPNALGKAYKLFGNANMQRLEYAFGRVTTKQAWMLANNLQWVEDNFDVPDMVSVIDAPAPVFNALSLGLFACRFSINISQIIKHTWFPTPEEDDGSLSACERFCEEVYDRQYHLLNDIVWFSVNLFCNYNAFWKLSDLFAGELTAIFLVFDALWLVWSRHLIEETYLIKKEQYEDEINQHTAQLEALGVDDDAQLLMLKLTAEIRLLDLQLIELEKEWQKNSANYEFSIAAAAVFTTGYSATLLFAAPAAIVFSWLMCTVAVAMYLSADEWASYRQKSYCLDIYQTTKAQDELDEARNAFICAMLKNILVPLLVTTCFALCWQVAAAGAVIYLCNCLLSEPSNPSLPAAAGAVNDEDSSSDDDDDEIEENARLAVG